VLCTTTQHNLDAAAFADSDGGVATVVLNRTEQEQCFALRIDDRRTVAILPPRSIATYLS
jgi:O-glycosyl hydrolase